MQSITRSVRHRFTELAGKLDEYNDGEIGPGHCSE
jgi:hypothetical protein